MSIAEEIRPARRQAEQSYHAAEVADLGPAPASPPPRAAAPPRPRPLFVPQTLREWCLVFVCLGLGLSWFIYSQRNAEKAAIAPVMGTWKLEGSPHTTLEFRPDGTVTEITARKRSEGTYEIEGQRILLEFSEKGPVHLWDLSDLPDTFAVNGDELNLFARTQGGARKVWAYRFSRQAAE